MTELRFDLASLREAYGSGLSPLDVIETVFARIEAANDPGIFLHLADKDALMAEARALGAFDPSRPLWGVPFAVKDNIDVAGMPTTAACPAFAYTPAEDATAVAKLKAAGALVVGKTNLDQFATGLVGLRTPYPVPNNAVDPALVPGGSSSGSAVATALGIVAFALGTDTAGSGRVPAGLNNIVGLKPTVGAISTSGVVPACRSLDCVSVFALTVEDATCVFQVAAGPDPADPFSRTVPAAPLAARPPALRIGVPAVADLTFFGDTAMEDGYRHALAEIEALGGTIVELPFGDFFATARLLYEGAFVAERTAAIADFMDAHGDEMHPVTWAIIAGGRAFSAVDAFNSLYALKALRAKVAPLIASVDLLCVPTAPTHYTVEEVLADPIGPNSRLGTYTNFVNLLDLCGLAIPTGTRSDGRPMSVTLLAAAGRDGLLAALGRDLHARSHLTVGATGWPLPAPQSLEAAGDDGIDLVVVGAHLSGMPLNGDLVRLGASFRRTAKTAPAYRLYALAGQSVPKPGLLRAPSGSGTAIEVEVWRLSPAAFGTFVAQIPPPLGIGTITLADGTTAKGFLVEAAGLDGAEDISGYGGWRSFATRTEPEALAG